MTSLSLLAGRTVYFSKYVHIHGCQNIWHIHIPKTEKRAIYFLFFKKMGYVIYLAAQKKGAFRHAHPHYVILGSYPPTPRDFDGRGFTEQQFSWSWSISENRTTWYIWIKSCMLINFNVVQQLVCGDEALPSIVLTGELLVKMLIALGPLGIFDHILHTIFSTTF